MIDGRNCHRELLSAVIVFAKDRESESLKIKGQSMIFPEIHMFYWETEAVDVMTY